jgi:hypothetical protein
VAKPREILSNRYGYKKGDSLSNLLQSVIETNADEITRFSLKKDQKKFEKTLNKIIPKRETKKIRFPDSGDMVKKQNMLIRAEGQGKKISQNMRKKLQNDLLNIIKEEGIDTQGKVRRSSINKFQKKITETFENYTVRNKKYGMPSNVRAIAVTETRTAVNNLRLEYAKKIGNETPGYRVTKTWIHNDIAKEPRQNHVKLNDKTLSVDQEFRVAGQSASGPHDPRLPAEQVINCNCELRFHFVRRKRQNR